MPTIWYFHLIWILVAGIFGAVLTAILAGKFHLRRNGFLVPYVLLVGVFIAGYVGWSRIDLGELVGRNWLWGIVGAIVLGVFLIKNIQAQPSSPRAAGMQLGFDLIWQGVVYGSVDATFLSVMPIAATWQAFSQLGWTTAWFGQLIVGAIALVASLLVTLAYHWSYPEYRGKQVIAPLIGNVLMSLGYLVTTSPIAALGSHIAMHLAGVLHGPETTVQLPPHYSERRN